MPSAIAARTTPVTIALRFCLSTTRVVPYLMTGAVSKVLDKLESKKLIVRTTSSADCRVQELSLTAHARRTLPSLTEIANGNDEHFFAVLSPEESSTLSELLRKLATAHHIARIPVA